MNIDIKQFPPSRLTRCLQIFPLAAMLLTPLAYGASADGTAPAKAVGADTQASAKVAPALASAQSAFKSEKDKQSYAMGMSFANQLRTQPTVDRGMFMKGLNDAIAGGNALMTEKEAREVVTTLQGEIKTKRAVLVEKQQKSKHAGETF